MYPSSSSSSSQNSMGFHAFASSKNMIKMESGISFYSGEEIRLDSKWLIDPKHLFVGPRIGEGAHAKVYEGNKNVKKKKNGREFKEVVGKELSPEMEVVVSHLYKEGYFSEANFVCLWEDRLDFSYFETAYGRGFIKHAADKFANDKQEIAKWVSGCDLKKVALFGCPLPANKSVFAAKRLRKFLKIPEQTVCSKCVLRESCKFANKNVWRGDPKLSLSNVGKANPRKLNLADVMDTIMLYALDSVDPQLVVPEDVKSSVSRLLKEILKLSQTVS